MKKLSAALITVGCLLIAAALLLPLTVIWQADPAVGIIGGVGIPTYWLVFRCQFRWLADIGVVLALAGGVLRWYLRKKKRGT